MKPLDERMDDVIVEIREEARRLLDLAERMAVCQASAYARIALYKKSAGMAQAAMMMNKVLIEEEVKDGV